MPSWVRPPATLLPAPWSVPRWVRVSAPLPAQKLMREIAARGGPCGRRRTGWASPVWSRSATLVQSNVADAVIIDQIHLTRSVYQLTPDQIVWLKQGGVSDTVIYAMQETLRAHAPRVRC